MKRTYISPEFNYNPVFGTMKMAEDSAFFGSKMLEIEDNVNILNTNLVYNQLSSNEQLDEKSEKSLPEVIYDTIIDKSTNHKIEIDLNQTDFQKNDKCKWILTIKLKTIFSNYLFAILKKSRTFEGVRNSMVKSNNVNNAISEYIESNIYSRYKFNRVELFLQHVDLTQTGTLQYRNTFDQFIESNSTLLKDFQTVINDDETEVTLNFNQKFSAQDFAFKYYFNLYFDKL